MNFASDNVAGVAPPILDAIVRANEGHALAYGADPVTRRVGRQLADLFERDVAVYLVSTGTAANALALAHLCPPWGAVLCHREAHILTSECGAPEFHTGGARLIGLTGDDCKIAAPTLRDALAAGTWGGPHHVSPAVLSITQASEGGTIYRADEIARLAEIAHGRGMAVHMDGARFANAAARLAATPAALTWRAGVDVLSLGATKGGALAAEAVVFFDPARAVAMAERRKRAGQLVSKHRFVAAQFEAFLADGLWLALARHANAQADRLGARLSAAGFAPVWPVEANLVFVLLPQSVRDRLAAAGATFYVLRSESLPPSVTVPPDSALVRLVCSHATRDEEIERFAAVVMAKEA